MIFHTIRIQRCILFGGIDLVAAGAAAVLATAVLTILAALACEDARAAGTLIL